jgi:hypothetical protein
LLLGCGAGLRENFIFKNDYHKIGTMKKGVMKGNNARSGPVRESRVKISERGENISGNRWLLKKEPRKGEYMGMESTEEEYLKQETVEACDFEDIYSKYSYDASERERLEREETLAELKRTYGFPAAKNFGELVEMYDRANITKRCLLYHNPDSCMLYFCREGDVEGFFFAAARGGQNWLECIEEICIYKKYNLLQIFFTLVGEHAHTLCAVRASEMCAKENDKILFDGLNKSGLLRPLVCFIQACATGNIDIVRMCTRVEPVLHPEGLVMAISHNHREVAEFLLGLGIQITNDAYQAARQNPTLQQLLQSATMRRSTHNNHSLSGCYPYGTLF